ncbi:MAG TPA: Sjogren's syndrome/scleroderma autoantigen 1 family protein [Candidatus Nitrosotalea sp.]|nr:Sjogren's syndrome/scleroderma autoantigen 1 family protein [Candidatus Nitrosotalea sp.]
MSEFTKKAVEMLLKGATLVSDPCPYCKGVRIMKDGNAFCANCGKGSTETVEVSAKPDDAKEASPAHQLDQKLKSLADELTREKDYSKQQQILKSIQEIIAAKEKLKRL